MLRHFLWDYFKESGDLEAYVMYKELERLDCVGVDYISADLDWYTSNDIQG